MRPAVVVFGAIGTVKIATVCDVKTALQRFPIEETLARFQNVIAGKFAANFVEKLHTMMKEHAAYDNLPAKQSRWEISLHNAATFFESFTKLVALIQRAAFAAKSAPGERPQNFRNAQLASAR